MQAREIFAPATPVEPELRAHDGHEWLYVLTGRMRLLLGEHDVVLGRGEVADFDTRVPHWFGSTGDASVEVLSLFGQQGERTHVRATSGQAQPR
jgi:mannose-6-phosphate isomerase-like protein (cupin superfamily)